MNLDLLYNFISPVTGKIILPEDYILIGDNKGYSYASPILKDIQYDIIALRRTLDTIEVFTDEISYRVQNIDIKNLPVLGSAKFPLPKFFPFSSLPEISMPNPIFNPLAKGDWIMSGPWLPQILAGSPNILNTSSETVISSALAMTQLKLAQTVKRFDNAGFIVKSRQFNFSWENPLMEGIPDIVKNLWNMGTSYTFTEAQVLDELGAGMLSNDNEGNLVLTKLTTNKIWQGRNNRPTEVNLSDAGIASSDIEYIIEKPNSSLPNAQNLLEIAFGRINGGILKTSNLGKLSIASGGRIPIANDYVDPKSLIETAAEVTEVLEAQIIALEAEIMALAKTVVLLGHIVAALTGLTIFSALFKGLFGGLFDDGGGDGGSTPPPTVIIDFKLLNDQVLAITGFNNLTDLSTFLLNKNWTKGYGEYLWDKYKPLRTQNFLFDTDDYTKQAGNIWYDINSITQLPERCRPGLRITSWDSDTSSLNISPPVSIGLFGYRNNIQSGYVWQSFIENDFNSFRYGFPKSFGLYQVAHDKNQQGWNKEEVELMEYDYYKQTFSYKKPVKFDENIVLNLIDVSQIPSNPSLGMLLLVNFQ